MPLLQVIQYLQIQYFENTTIAHLRLSTSLKGASAVSRSGLKNSLFNREDADSKFHFDVTCGNNIEIGFSHNTSCTTSLTSSESMKDLPESPNTNEYTKYLGYIKVTGEGTRHLVVDDDTDNLNQYKRTIHDDAPNRCLLKLSHASNSSNAHDEHCLDNEKEDRRLNTDYEKVSDIEDDKLSKDSIDVDRLQEKQSSKPFQLSMNHDGKNNCTEIPSGSVHNTVVIDTDQIVQENLFLFDSSNSLQAVNRWSIVDDIDEKLSLDELSNVSPETISKNDNYVSVYDASEDDNDISSSVGRSSDSYLHPISVPRTIEDIRRELDEFVSKRDRSRTAGLREGLKSLGTKGYPKHNETELSPRSFSRHSVPHKLFDTNQSMHPPPQSQVPVVRMRSAPPVLPTQYHQGYNNIPLHQQKKMAITQYFSSKYKNPSSKTLLNRQPYSSQTRPFKRQLPFDNTRHVPMHMPIPIQNHMPMYMQAQSNPVQTSYDNTKQRSAVANAEKQREKRKASVSGALVQEYPQGYGYSITE